jgi:hypothetical protein
MPAKTRQEIQFNVDADIATIGDLMDLEESETVRDFVTVLAKFAQNGDGKYIATYNAETEEHDDLDKAVALVRQMKINELKSKRKELVTALQAVGEDVPKE